MTARVFDDRTSSSMAACEDMTAQQQQQVQHQHHHHSAAWDAIRDQLEVQLSQEETSYRVGVAVPRRQPLHHNQTQPQAQQQGGQQQQQLRSPPFSSSQREDEPVALPPFTFSDGGDLDVCRRKMCEWAFNVVDYFDYSRDLVSSSLSHVDRYVHHLASSGQDVCKRRFQSVSVTALYMTLKMQGSSSSPSSSAAPHSHHPGAAGRRRHLNIRTFVELSRGILSVDALEEEERRMLDGLGYRINPPTPVGFVEYLVPLLLSAPSPSSPTPRVDDRTLHYVYELSRYYTELAVFERDLAVRHRPSCVAFASILCAMSAVDSSAFGTSGDARRSFASDALERVPCLRLGRAEVEDAWSRLAGLCPLEALDWPGMAPAAAMEQDGRKSPRGMSGQRAPTPQEEDDISQESPTCVACFHHRP